MAYNRSWHHRLLKHEDDDYNWADCEAAHLSTVPVTLLICLCGLVGNGAVLWFLSSHVRRNPITVYVLSLAVTNFTFLLSIAIAIVIFYSSGSFCHRLGSQGVTAVLNITILFTFTASVFLLTAFSAMMSLSILLLARGCCHRSWRLPVLACALLWALSFLLTMIVYFCPVVLIVFVLSYLLCVCSSGTKDKARAERVALAAITTLFFLASLALQRPRVLEFLRQHCSLEHREVGDQGQIGGRCLLAMDRAGGVGDCPGHGRGWSPSWHSLGLAWGCEERCVEVFLNLPSSHELFPENTSFLLALLNCSINPVIYFLVGNCRQRRIQGSVKAALHRVFEDKAMSKEESHVPEDTVVETTV
ncbi:proto-oncogene Mas-like [Grus japonensis]|uniref:Proto-oncogene Mas-like n=1 Tax=Grus japonensis TaxID=30415 RepID=A0ABC9WWB4_GRUJA